MYALHFSEGSHTLAKSVAISTTGLGVFQNLKRKSTCLGCKALLDVDGNQLHVFDHVTIDHHVTNHMIEL